jgi:lipopolysaccharide transport system ATP-binding protein
MSDDVLVKVDNVSKRFCRSLKRSLWYGLQDLGSEIGGRLHDGGSGLTQSSADVQLRPDEFWAVKDVSFELRRGECLGLIGRNGAGKTTLLRILNGLIKPDTGRIEMIGEVGSVIALGAGFNPILTGRENIYTSLSINGLSKERIRAEIDGIIEFAELSEFIDSPVQSYSSGMQVRLGFAVATALKPDVLILDEVLAVGDAQFRAKCYERIDKLKSRTAMIFVTHAMDQVARLCNKGLLLNRGQGQFSIAMEKVIACYENQNQSTENGFINLLEPISYFHASLEKGELKAGSILNISMKIHSKESISGYKTRTLIYNSMGVPCADSGHIPLSELRVTPLADSYALDFTIKYISLKPGKYFVSLSILGSNGELLVWSHKNYSISVVGPLGAAIDHQLLIGRPS